MSSGRIYSVVFTDVAISATQDLFNFTSTANMAIRLRRLILGQKTLNAWEAKGFTIKLFPATVTAGSGGTAPTPQKMFTTQGAATFTSRVNDTTAMTSNGTVVTSHSDDWVFTQGVDLLIPLGLNLIAGPSQGIAVNLTTAPSAPMTASGTAYIEELF